MRNALIKNSVFIILLCFSCKKSDKIDTKKQVMKYQINNKNSCDAFILKNDTVFLKNIQSDRSILSISSLKKSYVLLKTSCLEENGWDWNISFSCLDKEKQALLEFKKNYPTIDFDFVLYQSRNDEFFFKIKDKELFLVAYRYFIKDEKLIERVRAKNDTVIENIEIIKEKFIPFNNKLVAKVFNTDFICEYRDNRKIPFIEKELLCCSLKIRQQQW